MRQCVWPCIYFYLLHYNCFKNLHWNCLQILDYKIAWVLVRSILGLWLMDIYIYRTNWTWNLEYPQQQKSTRINGSAQDCIVLLWQGRGGLYFLKIMWFKSKWIRNRHMLQKSTFPVSRIRNVISRDETDKNWKRLLPFNSDLISWFCQQ